MFANSEHYFTFRELSVLYYLCCLDGMIYAMKCIETVLPSRGNSNSIVPTIYTGIRRPSYAYR